MSSKKMNRKIKKNNHNRAKTNLKIKMKNQISL